MAPPKKIDWTKPVRVVQHHPAPTPSVIVHGTEVLCVHNGRAFVTYGDGTVAYAANTFGEFDNLLLSRAGMKVENVPEEPANCIGLIKTAGDNGTWFVSICHECDAHGDEMDSDDQSPYIKPLPRSEVERFLHGLEPHIIIEVPL